VEGNEVYHLYFIGSQRELDNRPFSNKKLKCGISLSVSRARVDKYGEPKAGLTFFPITRGETRGSNMILLPPPTHV
jgi:hypothetical protein